MEQAEREKYFHLLNALDKMERMLSSSDTISHRKVLQGYWLRIKDEALQLGLQRDTEESRRFRKLFGDMTAKMRWQYHPRYCRNGTKWLSRKQLSKFWGGSA